MEEAGGVVETGHSGDGGHGANTSSGGVGDEHGRGYRVIPANESRVIDTKMQVTLTSIG